MTRRDSLSVPEPLITEIPRHRIPADPMTWVAAFADRPGLVFLDSALRHETLGRYSFIAADPIHRVTARGKAVEIDGAPFTGSPFDALDHLLKRYPLAQIAGLPPFQTGLAGCFGYGLRHWLEEVPAHRHRDHGFADLD